MGSPTAKPECPLGEICYRKKREHFNDWHHHHLEKILQEYGCMNIPIKYARKISHQTLKKQLKFLSKIKCNIDADSEEELIGTDSRSSVDANVNFCTISATYRSNFVSLNPTVKAMSSLNSSSKQVCSYGENCYRRNPQHFELVCHPHLNHLLNIIGDKDIFIPKVYDAKISQETLKYQLNILREQIGKEVKRSECELPKACTSSSSSSSIGAVGTDDKHNSKKRNCIKNTEIAARNESQAAAYKVAILDRINFPILDKLMAAAPYNFFLTTVTDSPATQSDMLSVTFAELIDPNLGDLECSLQINFMVEIGWMLAQYHAMGQRLKPITLLYGDVVDCGSSELSRFKHFMTSVHIKPPSTFGSHHTKMMIFSYTDKSIRVVVCTANLVESDWHNRTQGLWMSPKCRILPEGSDTMAGNSPTNFKRDLIKYLSAYKIPELVTWIKQIQKVDMSAIKVFLLASVPGTHKSQVGIRKHEWGHPNLARLLNDHVTVPDKNSYPVIVQCSSIGSLGPSPDSWLLGDMLSTFTSGKRDGIYSKPNLHFIYPSFENIASSYDGLLGGGCLPYSLNTHLKQEWVKSFMCEWLSESRNRTKAPPHIKSYCRISPDHKKLSYFVLTSANLSKAAWGVLSKTGSLNILSYEAGVLFLPQFFIDKDYFPISDDTVEPRIPKFPMPYDLPPSPYAFSDTPWFIENIS